MRPRQSVVLLQGLGEDRTSNFRSEAHPVLRCQNRRRGPGVAVQGHRRTSGLRAPVPGVLPAVRHYQDGQAGRPASRARDFRADIGGRPMTTPDLAARRPGQAGGKPQKAYTRAKNIRKRMGKGGSHPTHMCLHRNQSVTCMRSAYGQIVLLKFPTVAIGWTYALRIRMTGRS